MDRFFFRRHGSNTQRTPRAPAGLQIFRGILSWLTVLIRFPTEEEQQAAGIFLGKKENK